MKNYILKYASYSNNIFPGDAIDIKVAYFAGIQFSLEYNSCFIYFDAVTSDNRPIVLNFRMECESEEEFNSALAMYSHLFINGITAAVNIPSLTAVSCFYKQTTKLSVYYLLYALQINSEDDKTVFKLTMDRNIFCQVMFIMNKVRNFEDLSCNGNAVMLNKFNYFKPDMDVVKLSHFTPRILPIQKLYCSKPKFFDRTFTCYCIVNFSKDMSTLNLCFPVKIKNLYRQHKNKFTLDIKEFEQQMESSDTPSYFITDGFPIEFSLSADIPMSKFMFVGVSVHCKGENKYFNIPEEMFEVIGKLCMEFLEK